ncbi:hypothetical protein K5549_018226, partial [Capra hircus]
MSYPQFGYPYSSAPQLLMATNALSACCEPGGRSLADSGPAASAPAPVYCPVYESRLLATAVRLLLAGLVLRSAPAPGPGASGGWGLVLNSWDQIRGSAAAREVRPGPAHRPYRGALAHEQTAGLRGAMGTLCPHRRSGPFLPTGGASSGSSYGSVDSGTRRKNATRETTSTLKAWLQEHRKNPYPTKGEKIMLAIVTKMTLTQVSTWFANARRRLKKENKMTWPPRNKCADEKRPYAEGEEEEGGEEEGRGQPLKSTKAEEPVGKGKDLELSDLEDFDPLEGEPPECELKPPFQPLDGGLGRIPTGPEGPSAPGKEAPGALRLPLASGGGAALDQDLETARSCLRSAAAGPEQPAGAGSGPQACESKLGFPPSGASAGLEAKPRIWSLAHTATAAATTAFSQTEFPSCMLKRQGPPVGPAAPSSAPASSSPAA